MNPFPSLVSSDPDDLKDAINQISRIRQQDIAADNNLQVASPGARGYVPVTPSDATKFLNGAATPAFASVKDTDLSWTAWATYTPTVTAGSGTVTSASATGRYRTLGKTVAVQIVVTITTNGTAAANVMASLPVSANATYVMAGRANALSGKMLQGFTATTTVAMQNYDGTYPGANGETLILSGVYESV